MENLLKFAEQHKYELLLFALIQHLFIAIFLNDLEFYTRVIWPVNMFILGLASVGIFLEKGRWKNLMRNLLFIIVLFFPLSLPVFGADPYFMQILSILYTLFFMFIFWEVIRFLIKPSYINIDIISASACGYFLLIEITVFLMQFLFYNDPSAFNNISSANPAATYIDIVYFSTIIQTTIGFGDITPASHQTKLITSVIGTVGQFYTVVLIGILISKFTTSSD